MQTTAIRNWADGSGVDLHLAPTQSSPVYRSTTTSSLLMKTTSSGVPRSPTVSRSMAAKFRNKSRSARISGTSPRVRSALRTQYIESTEPTHASRLIEDLRAHGELRETESAPAPAPTSSREAELEARLQLLEKITMEQNKALQQTQSHSGVPPEVQARLDQLEAENQELQRTGSSAQAEQAIPPEIQARLARLEQENQALAQTSSISPALQQRLDKLERENQEMAEKQRQQAAEQATHAAQPSSELQMRLVMLERENQELQRTVSQTQQQQQPTQTAATPSFVAPTPSHEAQPTAVGTTPSSPSHSNAIQLAARYRAAQVGHSTATVTSSPPPASTTEAAPLQSTTEAPPPAAPPPSVPESIKRKFVHYDMNQDHLIDSKELSHMLDDLGFGVDPEYVKDILKQFGNFDRDSSGSMDMHEFSTFFSFIGGDLIEIFRICDENNDGVLSLHETVAIGGKIGLPVTAELKAQVSAKFIEMDIGGGEGLEFSEFKPLWAWFKQTFPTAAFDAIYDLGHPAGPPPAAAAAAGPKIAASTLRKFHQFDRDGNGVIDTHELERMLDELGFGVDEDYNAQILKNFGKFDADGNGCMDEEEFAAFFDYIGGDLIEVFRVCDVNDDGVLSLDETVAIGNKLGMEDTDELAQQITDKFREMDVGGGEGLEFSEFKGLWAWFKQTFPNQCSLDAILLHSGTETAPPPPSPHDGETAPPPEGDDDDGWGEDDDGGMPPPPPPKKKKSGMFCCASNTAEAPLKKPTEDFGGDDVDEFDAYGDDDDGEHMPPPHPPPAVTDEVQEKFDKYDSNSDGLVDKVELESMLLDLGFGVDEGYLTRTMQNFARYDTDGSEGLEVNEFAELWEYLGGDLVETFRDCDTANAQMLSFPQVENLAVKMGKELSVEFSQRLQEQFDLVDENKTGQVEFPEFKELHHWLVDQPDEE